MSFVINSESNVECHVQFDPRLIPDAEFVN